MKRKDTRILVESWRSFLKDDDKQKANTNIINEGAIADLALQAVSAYGPLVASVGGAILGSHVIKLAYDKIVNHVMKKGKNRKAFLVFLDYIKNVYENSPSNTIWEEQVRRIDEYDVDLWIESGDKVIKQSLKPNYKIPNRTEVKELESEVKQNRLRSYPKKIKELLSYWKADRAIESFEAKIRLEMYDRDSAVEASRFDYIIRAAYDNYAEGFDFTHSKSYYTNSAEKCAMCDVLFESMLVYFKLKMSDSALDLFGDLSELNEQFGSQFEQEFDKNGAQIIKIKENADIECMYAIADITIRNNVNSSSSGDDRIFSIQSPDFSPDHELFRAFQGRREITGSRIQKLEALKKFLLLVKKFIFAAATGGIYIFLQEFSKDFIKDEVLGEISETIKDKIDSGEINDTSDINKQEFAKFIISLLLE